MKNIKERKITRNVHLKVAEHTREKTNDKKPCTTAGEKNRNISIVMVTMHYLIYLIKMYKCRTPLPIDVIYRFLGKVSIKGCTKYIFTCYII